MSNRESSQNFPEMGTERQDWHRADIIAALRKKGTSVSALSREHGLASTTLANALRNPWPKGEKIIATAIGMPVQEIWPSRYPNLKEAG
ncbi:helix-turn-helix domain-containing protein [Aeromonas allosaccharophila]|uniref:helix-turn-helix domain-containing protein n=1 Tax=Aeromonas allosaccharophila TaxID=656 RepID=UPI001F1D8D07|nr:helix-turn-helix domain-containing protein [Aeromonas allosaccharophila]